MTYPLKFKLQSVREALEYYAEGGSQTCTARCSLTSRNCEYPKCHEKLIPEHERNVACEGLAALTAIEQGLPKEMTVDEIAKIMRIDKNDFKEGHMLIYLREYLHDKQNGLIITAQEKE